MDDDKAARAASRGGWPGRLTRLGQSSSDDISDETTMDERLAMMWELALRAYKLAGKPLPDYSRSDMPGTVIRPPR